MAQMAREAAAVRAAYAPGGDRAAKQAARGTLAELYGMDYRTWRLTAAERQRLRTE